MSRKSIVVVDDLPIFRDLAAMTLAPIVRVFTAADDAAARTLLQRETIDLVLAHYPPAPAGSDSICSLVKRDPRLARIPVILVTGGQDPEHHAAAVRAGADDVLTKPLDRVSLLAAVRRLVEAPIPRGLPRVLLEAPVRLAGDGTESWGVARNLSRGGMFVETELPIGLEREIDVEFPLPGRSEVLAPKACVVWVRRSIPPERGGLGLRFLGLDGASARSLEHFVHEHRAPRPASLEVST